MKIFLGIFLIVLSIYLIISYIFHLLNSCGGQTTRMKWKDVKRLYRINPRRWEYECDASALIYDKTIVVRLSFLGFIILELHYLMHICHKERCYKTEGLEYILKTAQKDIDKLKQEAIHEISTATKMQGEIAERMNKNA